MRGKTFFEKKVFPRAPYPKNFMKGMDLVCAGIGEERYFVSQNVWKVFHGNSIYFKK